MKRIVILLALFLFIFQACKKDDNGTKTPDESVLDYMPLAIGNQWIYEVSLCDSGELNCDEPFSTDTNIVSKDTTIAGYSYFKIDGPHMYWKGPRFYRDSGDYIVDHQGKIIFTINQSEQTYNHTDVVIKGDTAYYWYNWLKEDPEDISVKAGTFSSYDFQGSFFSHDDDFRSEHNWHNYYSKNVGLIRETRFFASNFMVTKRELVGYVIHPKSTVIP